MMIKVSVIYPNYNCVDLTERALNSIDRRKDIEIIIVDDCSTDGSDKVVEEWIAKNKDLYGNIILIKQKENKGSGAAFNIGLEKAMGEYIIILNNDDYFMRPLSEFYHWLDGKNDMVYYNLLPNSEIPIPLDETSKHTFVGATKFIRREFIGDTRRSEQRFYNDVSFYKELAAKKPVEVYSRKILYYYNNPREGSLIWQAGQEALKKKKKK